MSDLVSPRENEWRKNIINAGLDPDQMVNPYDESPRWMTPEQEEQCERDMRRYRRIQRLTSWMKRIPIVGSVVYVFWSNTIDEGLLETVKPRWGAMTFSFLNDGMHPTLWHTLYSMTHDDHDDNLAGLYPGRAPRNRAEAQAVVNGEVSRWRVNREVPR